MGQDGYCCAVACQLGRTDGLTCYRDDALYPRPAGWTVKREVVKYVPIHLYLVLYTAIWLNIIISCRRVVIERLVRAV